MGRLEVRQNVIVNRLDTLILKSKQPEPKAILRDPKCKLNLPLKTKKEVEEAQKQLEEVPDCQIWLVCGLYILKFIIINYLLTL